MKNIAIIGASGALGQEFVKQYAARQEVAKIFAFSRQEVAFSDSKIVSLKIDLADEDSIQNAALKIDEKLDLIIVASGMLHDDLIRPEKSLRDLSFEKFNKIYAVNTIGPALVAKYFIPKLHRNKKAIFAAISARVGSISDNYLGGWYSYRSSKAALNMILRNISIEMLRTNKDFIAAGLHPGTVDSSLSKPFQGAVAKEKLFTPFYSVSNLIQVLGNLTSEDSGKVFAYDGKEISS